MTGRAGAPRVPRAWALPVLALVAILALTRVGVLSGALLVDLVSWWPLWLALLASAVLARGATVGRIRVSGVIPLMLLAGLGGLIWAHLAGWEALPSGRATLIGPRVGATSEAALSARLDGKLRVRAGDTFLYVVEPLRGGGEHGLPTASEESQGSAVSVVLRPSSAETGYSGWEAALAHRVRWSLTLSGDLGAELAGLELAALQLSGRGTVELGAAATATPVTVDGDFRLLVPAGARARVIGQAEVPDTWGESGDGWIAPAGDGGWVISVSDQSSVRVEES